MPTRVRKKGVFYQCINNNKNFGLIYGGSKLPRTLRIKYQINKIQIADDKYSEMLSFK